MFGKKNPKPKSRIDSLIGAGTRIDGQVLFSGGLRIDGQVRGDVRCDSGELSTLVLSEHASIEGAVSVSHAVINGTVRGPVVASEFLELQPQAKVFGDVTYKRIEIHLGAIVKGRLEHQAGAHKAFELKIAKGA